MAYLGNDLQVAFPVYRKIDNIAGSFNGVTKTFALTVNGVAPVPAPLYSQQCLISVAGVVQQPDDTGVKGFRLSGNNIIFASAPAGGADFFGIILAGADYVDAGGNYPSGTASVPSITFNDDLDTGIYNSGINQLSFSTGGSERLRIDSAGQIEASYLGTAAAPTYSFIGDPNTGIYSPGADQVTISTGGTGRVFVDASGRVGVGVSPTANLDVVGGVVYDGNFNLTAQFRDASGAAEKGILLGYNSANTSSIIAPGYANGSGALAFWTQNGVNWGERARITSDGKVGIGTNSPNYRLDVTTTGTSISSSFTSDQSEQYIALKDSGTTLGHVRLGSTSGAMLFNAGNAERLRITSDGKVGIGTSSPSEVLDTVGNIQIRSNAVSGSPYLVFNSKEGSGGVARTCGQIQAIAETIDGWGLGFYTRTNGTPITEKLRITNDGNVGIGTSSPSQTLHVENTNLVNPSLTWGASATQTIRVSAIRELALGVTGASPYDCYLQARNNANTAQALLLNPVGGNVGIGTSSWTLNSVGTKMGVNLSGTTGDGIALFSGQNSANQYVVIGSQFSNVNSNNGSQIRFGIDSSGDTYSMLAFATASGGTPSEKMRIDSSGRLLVGVSAIGTNVGTNRVVIRDTGNANGLSLIQAATPTGSQGPAISFGAWDNSLSDASPAYTARIHSRLRSGGVGAVSGDLGFAVVQSGTLAEVMSLNAAGYLKAANDGSPTNSTLNFHGFDQSTAGDATLYANAKNASYTGDVLAVYAQRTNSSLYDLAEFVSTHVPGVSGDTEFRLRGDGQAFADGSWSGGGADYAEYFEWVDSNPNAEDRRGISVVLDGNKIREALPDEDPIGVISGNPSVVGDAAWNKWTGKYLRDDYGTYIQEDYEVEDEDGNTFVQQRRKLNPAYNPDEEYISREQRPEWDCVGLMGKLRIRKGQVTGSRWIKMRDISTTVEEWLVR